MKAPPMMKPPGATMKGAGPRTVRPHIRLQKIHLGGKTAFPGGAAAFDPNNAAPGGTAAFPAGDGGMGAAGGDTGP